MDLNTLVWGQFNLEMSFNMILTHAIAFVSLGKAELTSILTYFRHIYIGRTLGLQCAYRIAAAYAGFLKNSYT